MVLDFSDFNRVVPLSNKGYLCSHGMRLQRGLMEDASVRCASKFHCRKAVDDEYGVDLDEGQ